MLGLRLVKRTVNLDAPDMYHLYYGDETGAPGSILTFFEIPGARPGTPGDGMIHRTIWSVGAESLGFWAVRLARAGVDVHPEGGALVFADPEGLAHELVAESAGPPLVAVAVGIPAEHALRGIAGVRAYAGRPERGRRVLTGVLGLREGAGDHATGLVRNGRYVVDPPPGGRARPGPARSITSPGPSPTRTTPAGPIGWPPRGWARPRSRPAVLPLDLLPRAERGPVRDRVARPGILHRRAGGSAGPEPAPTAPIRVPARGARALCPLRVTDHMEAIDE